MTATKCAFLATTLLFTALRSIGAPVDIPDPKMLTYKTSWVGNSFGGQIVPGIPYHKHVQIGADDVFVASDGTVYTNATWDENGYEAGFYRNGDVAGALEELSHGWGRAGGKAVTASSRYVFAGMVQNGDDGADQKLNANGLRQFPDPGTQWFCVRRFTRDGRTAPFPGGLGWKNDMLVVNQVQQNAAKRYPAWDVAGLATDGNRLFVSDPGHSRVRVYDIASMSLLTDWPCTKPGKLAADGTGRLWVLEDGNGAHRSIFALNASSGKRMPGEITGSPNWDPRGIHVDQARRLFVADSGPDQNIKIYDISRSVPKTPKSTFGMLGGIFAANGRVGERRLNMPVGAGMDAHGNTIVFSEGSSSGGGSVIESYSPKGARIWQLLGLEFIDCAETDPASETDIYTKEEHFGMDYGRPAGKQWSYRGYTIDRHRYPDDPRLHTQPTSVFVRRIGGKLFLFSTDMYSSELAVSRFVPKSMGEYAVPSVFFVKGTYKEGDTAWPKSQPAHGEWIWRDTNGDGQIQKSEFLAPSKAKDAPDGWGWSVDSAGNVWQTSDRDGIREFPVGGFDKHGVPSYSFSTVKTFPMPAPFVELCRAEYVPATDTMYLAGYTTDHPHAGGEWGAVGSEVVRFDQWSKGDHTPKLRISLPYDGLKDAQVYIKAMCVAGDYLFAVEGRDPERVFVYDTRTGALLGKMQPSSAIGNSSGWVDTPYGIRAVRRANGEYQVFVEEDLDAKVIMYQWTPGPGT